METKKVPNSRDNKWAIYEFKLRKQTKLWVLIYNKLWCWDERLRPVPRLQLTLHQETNSQRLACNSVERLRSALNSRKLMGPPNPLNRIIFWLLGLGLGLGLGFRRLLQSLTVYATIIYQYCNIAWLILNLKLITEKYEKHLFFTENTNIRIHSTVETPEVERLKKCFSFKRRSRRTNTVLMIVKNLFPDKPTSKLQD